MQEVNGMTCSGLSKSRELMSKCVISIRLFIAFILNLIILQIVMENIVQRMIQFMFHQMENIIQLFRFGIHIGRQIRCIQY